MIFGGHIDGRVCPAPIGMAGIVGEEDVLSVWSIFGLKTLKSEV